MFFWSLVALDCFIFIAWIKSNKAKRQSARLWFITAASGLVIFTIDRLYYLSIGCPYSGDCYLPGSSKGLYIDALLLAWFFILMPVSLYKIISITRMKTS